MGWTVETGWARSPRSQKKTPVFVHQVLEYHRYGFRIVAFLGANRSPNCGVETTSDRNQEMPGRGLFLGALEDRIQAAGLEIPLLGVKASDDLLNLFARLRPLL